MTTSHTQKRSVARGFQKNSHKRRVNVEFDAPTFDQVRQRAIAQGTSFGEQVRILVEWGLEAETNDQ